ncbi:hypothetical protein YC2023_058909 [Brassica napus]
MERRRSHSSHEKALRRKRMGEIERKENQGENTATVVTLFLCFWGARTVKKRGELMGFNMLLFYEKKSTGGCKKSLVFRQQSN